MTYWHMPFGMNWKRYLMLPRSHICCVAAQEIDRESSQGHVNQEQLRHMPYTEACVKEALRLYPPATALARQLTQDMQIMGHRVPKGTGIFVRPPRTF